MKKIIFGIIVVVLVLGVILLKNRPTTENNPDSVPVIKIGVSLPLTGEYAEVGMANKKAIQLALDSQKNTKYKYELIFEDDATTPRKGALNAQRFISSNKVNAMMSVFSMIGNVLTDAAQRNQVIHFACGAGDQMAEPFYSFNNFTQDDAFLKVVLEYLRGQGAKRIAYATSNTISFGNRADYMEKELQKHGFEVVALEKYTPDTKDFRVSILKMEQKKPDYYIMTVISPGTALFLKQFSEITGKKKNILGIDVFYEMQREYWSLANGLVFAKSARGTPEFIDTFKEKTGLDVAHCIANSYDNLNLLIWGFENTEARAGEKVPNNEDVVYTILGKKSGDGAMGKFEIDEKGLIRSEASLMQMVNGEMVPLENEK